MSAAGNAIEIFTRQWYNALTTAANLSPLTFQLAQGSLGLGTTKDIIWQAFDSIPPASLNQLFNPGALNSFANTYGAVINNLYPQNGDAEQKALGDKYAAWVTFQQKNDPPDSFDWSQPDAAKKARLAVFNKFAYKTGVDQGKTTAMLTVLNQTDRVSEAITKFNAAKDNFAYTASFTTLQNALKSGQPKVVKFNSNTQSSDTSRSWAKGEVSGAYKFFSAEASAEWSKFTEDLSRSGFDITVKFAKLATLTAGPYSNNSRTDPDLLEDKPWYDSAVLNMAYKNNNNKVWKHESPTWEETFGENGSLKRTTTGLIIVDGITSTITTSASVSSDKRDAFKAAAKAGFWPFFQAEGEGGWTHNVTFKDDGSITVESSTKEGNPNILGFSVQDFTSQLSWEKGKHEVA
ncbi:MAG TPA: hypothetical protein V6D26_26260 [Stenomitos sp.]